MSLSRILNILNWTLVFSAAVSVVYLGNRNAELESRYAALAAFVDVRQTNQGGKNTNSSMSDAAVIQEIRVLQTQVTALRRDFEAWKEKANVLQPAQSSLLPGDLAVRNKQSLTSAEIEEINRQQKEQNSGKLHDFFETEPVDPVWSRQMIALIEKRSAKSEKELLYAKLLATECKSTLCRIEVVHENVSQQAEFESALPMLLGNELPRTMMFSEDQPDGSTQQTIYLAREGYDFP